MIEIMFWIIVAVSWSAAVATVAALRVDPGPRKSLTPLRGVMGRLRPQPPTPLLDIPKVRRIEFELGLEPWWFEGQEAPPADPDEHWWWAAGALKHADEWMSLWEARHSRSDAPGKVMVLESGMRMTALKTAADFDPRRSPRSAAPSVDDTLPLSDTVAALSEF